MTRLDLPFDQYQRYGLLGEIVPILENSGPAYAVLEVGGFPPRLGDFLPGRAITTVDVQEHEGPGYARARGDELPFADRSFDLAVSVDTLEHVQPEKRGQFISELCRVASRAVIVAAPFASEAVAAADRAVFEFVRARGGYEHQYFKEHLEIEPPELDATRDALAALGLDVAVIPSGRLGRWMLMMAAYYALDTDPALRDALPHLNEAYNRSFYEHDKAEPAYRHFLVAARDSLGDRRDRLAALRSASPESADHAGIAQIIELARDLGLKNKDREIAALTDALAARDREIAALKEHIAALEDFRARVTSLPLYSFYERHIKPMTRK